MHLSAETVVGIIAVMVALPPIVFGLLKACQYQVEQPRLPIYEHRWPYSIHNLGGTGGFHTIPHRLLTRLPLVPTHVNDLSLQLARPGPVLLRHQLSLPVANIPPLRISRHETCELQTL